MIIVVTGGRDFKDVDYIHKHINKLHSQTPITLLIHGNASGVDKICGAWSLKHQINTFIVPAKWNLYDKAAGSLRNREMADLPYFKIDYLLSFPGGRGTADMTNYCKSKQIPIIDCTK